MRLVTESEYEKLKGIQDERSKILSAQDIPSDVKNIIYQDLARRLHQKQNIESSRPVLVKEVDPKEPPQNKGLPSIIAEPYILQQVASKRGKKNFKIP